MSYGAAHGGIRGDSIPPRSKDRLRRISTSRCTQPAAPPTNYITMNLPTPTALQLQAMAEDLVRLAAQAGLVLTVEQVSQKPPAMGNHTTVVSVRPARSKS